MPELPEVETVCRGLSEVMEGRVLAAVQQNRPDLRFPFPEDFAVRLTGRRVIGMNRRAKYILARLEGGDILINSVLRHRQERDLTLSQAKLPQKAPKGL